MTLCKYSIFNEISFLEKCHIISYTFTFALFFSYTFLLVFYFTDCIRHSVSLRSTTRYARVITPLHSGFRHLYF